MASKRVACPKCGSTSWSTATVCYGCGADLTGAPEAEDSITAEDARIRGLKSKLPFMLLSCSVLTGAWAMQEGVDAVRGGGSYQSFQTLVGLTIIVAIGAAASRFIIKD
jgi:hypothetical protein